MNAHESEQAVRDRQRVVANYATGIGAHVAGVVIAYSHAPQVCILTDDGRRVWWRADLTTATTDQHRETPMTETNDGGVA